MVSKSYNTNLQQLIQQRLDEFVYFKLNITGLSKK